jgi:hypothetical protein
MARPNSTPLNSTTAPGVPDGGTAGAGLGSLDRQSANEAYRKVLEGRPLSSRERTLLKRVEKDKEERLRWQYYGSIPQKHWRQMSGRQTKVLHEQAARYGIPFGGPHINLPAVVRALHDFLAENAVKLARDEDELMQGGASPALERYRQERAMLARLDRLEREGSLVPRDEVRDALARISALLRAVGEALQRQFGREALELYLEGLDDVEREINRSFGEEPVRGEGKQHAAAEPSDAD